MSETPLMAFPAASGRAPHRPGSAAEGSEPRAEEGRSGSSRCSPRGFACPRQEGCGPAGAGAALAVLEGALSQPSPSAPSPLGHRRAAPAEAHPGTTSRAGRKAAAGGENDRERGRHARGLFSPKRERRWQPARALQGHGDGAVPCPTALRPLPAALCRAVIASITRCKLPAPLPLLVGRQI